jgi:hypothetical protein
MTNQQRGGGPSGPEPRDEIAARLVDDLLTYLPRLVRRHGLRKARISVNFHERHVVGVTCANSTTFRLPSASESGPESVTSAHDEHRYELPHAHLTWDELNARIALRLDRLLRHFGIHFGMLHIEIDDDGAIDTICPSPLFYPSELKNFARLLSGQPQGKPSHRSPAPPNGVLGSIIQRKCRFPMGSRRNRGTLV